MKNIDIIRAMSAEELAIWKNKPCPCRCEFNKNCNIVCKALIDWLNKENNPMPNLKVGDILTSKEKRLWIVVGESCCIDPIGHERKLCAALDILKIDRVHSGFTNCFDTIWRADNEQT
jgi:hypothetical protein